MRPQETPGAVSIWNSVAMPARCQAIRRWRASLIAAFTSSGIHPGRLLELGGGRFEGLEADAVEPLGEGEEGRVAAQAHLLDDLAHRACERGLGIGVRRPKEFDPGGRAEVAPADGRHPEAGGRKGRHYRGSSAFAGRARARRPRR